MQGLNLQHITERVISICQLAEEQVITPIVNANGFGIESKDNTGRNFVTKADLETELLLKEELSNLLPTAGFIAEETAASTQPKGLNWIIDPIDGTTNFMHQAPPYCISVALANDEEILCGVIYELFHQEVFYAWKNGGAYLDRKKLSVSTIENLSESLLVTGFPYDQGSVFDDWISLFGSLTKKTQGVRRYGAAAVDLCYVAAGRLEGFYEYSLNAWDVAAGVLLVQEAGGKVTDFHGGADYLFGRELVSTNTKVHTGLLKIIQQHFSKA